MKNYIVIAAAAAMIAGMTSTAKAQGNLSSLTNPSGNSGLSFSSLNSDSNNLTFSSGANQYSASALAASAASFTSAYSDKKTESRKQDRRGTSAADMLVGTGVAGSILVFRRRKP